MYILSSQFYELLDTEGLKKVETFTTKRNVNIFQKKFIFIPINQDLHWSLLVVVNPGKMNTFWAKSRLKEAMKMRTYAELDLHTYDMNEEIPCILMIDPYKEPYHCSRKIVKNVVRWLNAENVRVGHIPKAFEPYNDIAFFQMKAPRQPNSYDCGVYVCKYAYALMSIVVLHFMRLYNPEQFASSDQDDCATNALNNQCPKRMSKTRRLSLSSNVMKATEEFNRVTGEATSFSSSGRTPVMNEKPQNKGEAKTIKKCQKPSAKIAMRTNKKDIATGIGTGLKTTSTDRGTRMIPRSKLDSLSNDLFKANLDAKESYCMIIMSGTILEVTRNS